MMKEAFDEETMLELHEHWCMQDGAPAHSSKVVIDWLEAKLLPATYRDKIIFSMAS